MRIQFFSQYTFAKLLEIRDNLCRYRPTQNVDVDAYIGPDKQSNTAFSRTERCVRLIDMVIVARAVEGKLVEKNT